MNLLRCGSSRSGDWSGVSGLLVCWFFPSSSSSRRLAAGAPAAFAKRWAEHEAQVSKVWLECTFWQMVIKLKQVKMGGNMKGQNRWKSCHQGRSPVILKQITLFQKSSANIEDDRWWHLIYTVTFMISLHPMCVYKTRHKNTWIFCFGSSRVQEDRKSCHFKEILLQSRGALRAQWHPIKELIPHTIFCVSQVLSNI